MKYIVKKKNQRKNLKQRKKPIQNIQLNKKRQKKKKFLNQTHFTAFSFKYLILI